MQFYVPALRGFLATVRFFRFRSNAPQEMPGTSKRKALLKNISRAIENVQCMKLRIDVGFNVQNKPVNKSVRTKYAGGEVC